MNWRNTLDNSPGHLYDLGKHPWRKSSVSEYGPVSVPRPSQSVHSPPPTQRGSLLRHTRKQLNNSTSSQDFRNRHARSSSAHVL
ncbi:hypothetical protein E2C01_072140 [Portunus trituberculatus]|uniref:Uncharacterized protein n=1 Tax=Portunus trituberculatus TaxID=210409 RepID=A0A5B7HX81_PORTR|nr:hypothetical protein [Portunus trituberculatus]